MNPYRIGLRRGLIELRQSFTNPGDLFNHLFWPVLMLVAMYFMRDATFGATGLGLGALALPSVLGLNVAAAMLTMSQHLTIDREDGTLLRAKATPHGMRGHLTGKLVLVGVGLIAELAIFLVPGLFIVPGLATGGVTAWLTVAWVALLGVVAALPLGAVLGSVLGSPRGQGLLQVPFLGLIGISGIFYPISALPEWVQWIAQAFPFYWLGLGMRSALLPDAAVAVEIGQSWRHLETVGVLGAWAVLGLLLAPVVLRRMARGESGSSVAGRRDRALQRVG
ncbi:ABC transporter permease [Nonomuraea sp. NBC_01738]|uniref:ABC transporter permease n=1 Tax=Nonomuraea sp. NBC_01738 TaxID=2976003 RepID=UPI002E15BFA0|nr:ABC transporter permease [Nonomuraea sp. NBC_01738]